MIHLTWGLPTVITVVLLVIILGLIWRYVGVNNKEPYILPEKERRSSRVMWCGYIAVFTLLSFGAFDTGTRTMTIDKTVFDRDTNVVVVERVQLVKPSAETTQNIFDQLTDEKQTNIDKELSK